MFRKNSLPFILALVLGAGLAVGVSVWATSVGTNVTVTGNLSVDSTTASSSVTYGLGVGTTTPGTTLAVGGSLFVGATSAGGTAGGFGVGIASTTAGVFETTGDGLVGGALNVGGATMLNGTLGVTGVTTLSGATTLGSSGTSMTQINHGWVDCGPIIGSNAIAASSTGIVGCSTGLSGLSAGDKIWLTASTTTQDPTLQGLYIYTGIASTTAANYVQAEIWNVTGASYTVTTSTWQYFSIK